MLTTDAVLAVSELHGCVHGLFYRYQWQDMVSMSKARQHRITMTQVLKTGILKCSQDSNQHY